MKHLYFLFIFLLFCKAIGNQSWISKQTKHNSSVDCGLVKITKYNESLVDHLGDLFPYLNAVVTLETLCAWPKY